jgi:quercetin dioxygenase-like cupin family protein
MHHGGPVVRRPGEDTTIEGPVGGPLTFKVRGEQTNGTFTALENVIPPRQGPPLHTHASEDEAWYVLEGELRFKLDGQVRAAPAGTFVFVPRGTPHCFQNVADTPARILVMFTPAGMERFFDEFASLPATSPQAFATIGEPLGMNVIGPPLAQSDLQ